MRESVIYQSIRQEGKQEGLKQEALAIALRLLRRCFSELEAPIVAKVQALPRKRLEELSEDLLDFSEVEDLDA